MRKSLSFLLMIVFFASSVFAQTQIRVNLKADNNSFTLLSKSSTGLTVVNKIAALSLSSDNSKHGDFTYLSGEGLVKIYKVGYPNIPVVSKLIEVPQNATVEFNIVSYDEETIQLSDYGMTNPIAPAQASLSKSQDPDKVPFVLNSDVYSNNKFLYTDIATYEESGMMRNTRLGRIELHPVQYNPVTNTLKVLNNLKVEITFKNANFSKTSQLQQKYASPYFENILNDEVINHEKNTKNLITQNPVEYVIVSDRMFESTLAPFIAWKTLKGFHVTVAYTDVIGTTTTAIKTYLQGLYQGTTPPTFVLLVGDIAQIPAFAGTTESHSTDLYYFEYTGDFLPEVFYGRFSANNVTELQPQIDKTLEFEKYLMPDPSYLANNILIAGVDAGHAPTYGNGAINYATDNYCNAAHTITPLSYLYADAANSTVMASDNSGAAASIISKINAGAGFVNYTAHGDIDEWYDPNITVTSVHALTNAHKYGLLIGNCCLTNSFQITECFGESLLRKANGGSVGYIGGSNSTYWDEDYYWGVGLTSSISAHPTYAASGEGAYDGLFHDLANQVNPSTWFITQDQVLKCGNLAVQSSCSTLKSYYWEIYHLMGDPSLMPYYNVPSAMTVVPSPATLMIGMTSLDVTAAPYAYVALSMDGTLLATAVADDSGLAHLTFAALANVGTADLVVTAQSKQPYIGTITVSPADSPYVVLNSFTTSASPDYGQDITMNVTLENVAASGSGYDAANVNSTISTTDAYATITDNTENYGAIVAGNTKLIDNAFGITLANNIPDQHVINFNLAITGDPSYSWPGIFSITANAPEITIGEMTITNDDNSDYILDPGETADLDFTISNTGHASIDNLIGTISTTGTHITLNSVTTSPVTVAADGIVHLIFNVTADALTPNGTSENIDLSVTGGASDQYTASASKPVVIGFVPNYCAATSGSTTYEYISKVVFGSINNSSAATAYTDFTSISTNVTAGQTYPITVTVGSPYSTDEVICWADWNYNGVFDDSEKTTLTWASPTASGNIVVPSGIISRPVTMRIRLNDSGSSTSNSTPCGASAYGEVEDYTLNITPSSSVSEIEKGQIAVYPNPSTGFISVDLSQLKNNAKVTVYNITGQEVYLNQKASSVLQVDLSNQSKGIYFVKITSDEKIFNQKIVLY